MEKLTKSQRRRRNERVKKEQERQWAELMGPAPDDDVGLFGEGNLLDPAPMTSAEKAPAHMVDYDPLIEDDTPQINKDKAKSISKRAGDIRSEDTQERYQEIRASYSQHIGVRGGAAKAHAAALRKYNAGGKKGEPPPSMRTFQRALSAPKNKKSDSTKGATKIM